MNYRIILYVLGNVLKVEALAMVLPLVCSLMYKEFDCVFVFIICILLCLICGVLLSFKQPQKREIYAKEGFVTAALSWIIISIFGSIPFIISGYIPNFIDALFETASGFTTTGASILEKVEYLPKGILFWRSFTHWIGGMGVLVFLLAILPASGGSNVYLMRAESPGPSVSKLVPRLRETARILYGIYIFITVILTLLLLIGKLDLFEALVTTFETVGTGGFAVRNSSAEGYSSYVQIVINIFMLLCGVDFTAYYLIIMKKGKLALKSDEIKTYFLIYLTATILITINCIGIYPSIFDTIKHSSFQVASIMTTTGFTTTDFNVWPSFSKTIIVLLMFIGACAGSTGGGIKVSRIIIALKSIIKEIKISSHPRNIEKVTINKRVVEHETLRAINVYFISYIAIFTISLLIISLDNLDFTTNFTAVAATMNNIGPGLSEVGPSANYSIYSPLSTFVLTIDMLIGRLEIFPFLVLCSPYAWKK